MDDATRKEYLQRKVGAKVAHGAFIVSESEFSVVIRQPPKVTSLWTALFKSSWKERYWVDEEGNVWNEPV